MLNRLAFIVDDPCTSGRTEPTGALIFTAWPARCDTLPEVEVEDAHELGEAVERIVADVGFSGTVRVDRGGRARFECATGMAHRGLGVPNSTTTQFGVASGTKTLTALTVMTLVERDEITLDTTARSLLGTDLPLIDDGVTVEHLLVHRSGIGDYLDEDVVTDFNENVMTVPVHELATTEDYLRVLDGHPTKFAPGDAVRVLQRRLRRAGAARRTGHRHALPRTRRASGSAGPPAWSTRRSCVRTSCPAAPRSATSTTTDCGRTCSISRSGGAATAVSTRRPPMSTHSGRPVLGGRVVAAATVDEMVRPHTDVTGEEAVQYGFGFFIDARTGRLSMHGFDAGVGFVSVHDRARGITHTVMSNQSRGAWPVSQRIDALVGTTV